MGVKNANPLKRNLPNGLIEKKEDTRSRGIGVALISIGCNPDVFNISKKVRLVKKRRCVLSKIPLSA